jgi:hypothetical protein
LPDGVIRHSTFEVEQRVQEQKMKAETGREPRESPIKPSMTVRPRALRMKTPPEEEGACPGS